MKTLILTASLGIVAMLAEIFGLRKYLWYVVIAGLLITIGVTVTLEPGSTEVLYKMMMFDTYASAFSILILVLTLFWFLIAKDQYEVEFNVSDHFALILFSVTGGIVLSSFLDLSMLFLGIEIVSIPLYILAGSHKKDLASNEASLKYFLMGAFATGILLFGITLIYGATGTFNIIEIGQTGSFSLLFYAGVLLVMIGLGFKVSAVPFHFWTPDVYQGAPVMITAFMATIVKVAGFAGFYRLFSYSFAGIAAQWQTTLAVMIALTILVGNIIAIYQTSVKRMLAYSGIAQAGYLLMTLLILNEQSSRALLFYTGSYALSSMAAFGVLYYVMKAKGDDSFESFNSLGKTHPFLAAILSISMLSLAGIPPAIGFFAKFYLFATVLKFNEGQYLWLVVIAVIGSLISVYYYFRLIMGMYAREGGSQQIEIKPLFRTVLIIITAIIVILGVAPGLLIDKI